jgi:hypothetical protein
VSVGWTWAQTAIVLAASLAVVGALVTAVLGYLLNQRAARRERQAKTFAEALSAVEDYAELPYRVRRRSGDVEARLRLTEDISRIQSRIAFYQAWLRIEEPGVAAAYEALVRSAKRQAGEQMRDAWTHRVRRKDHQMNLLVAYPRDEIDRELAQCVVAMRADLGYRILPPRRPRLIRR